MTPVDNVVTMLHCILRESEEQIACHDERKVLISIEDAISNLAQGREEVNGLPGTSADVIIPHKTGVRDIALAFTIPG